MESFRELIEWVGTAVDAAGVFVIVAGAVLGAIRFFNRADSTYQTYRQSLGRAILLGLELLVAGDIIRTVGVAPTRENVLVLGLVVVIRTVLSFSMELELEGRWPWQRRLGEAIPSSIRDTPPRHP